MNDEKSDERVSATEEGSGRKRQPQTKTFRHQIAKSKKKWHFERTITEKG